MSAFSNKFALLSEVSEKKRRVVVSDGLLPRKNKKAPSEKTKVSAPAAAAATEHQNAVKPTKKSEKKAPAAVADNAPKTLKEAIEFNKQKAAAAEKAAAEKAAAAAEKAAADKAAAAAEKAAAAAADTAAADNENGKPQEEHVEATPLEEKKKEAPKPQVKTLAEIESERAEARFAIAAKKARAVNTTAVKALTVLEGNNDELVIKPKQPVKTTTTAAAKSAAKGKTASPVAPQPKKEKAETIELKDFADFEHHDGRGRGRGRGSGFRGRGGYHAAPRVPVLSDSKAFPSLV